MGQAFDGQGNVLGEASGESKREVLRALEERFGAAAKEVRIRDMEIRAVEGPSTAPKDEAKPVDRMLQFFAHAHLPPHLAVVSAPFCRLAEEIVTTLPANPERTVALRKLLEAKDCAVRALLFQ